MKKIIIFSIALLMGTVSFAQQALWGGQEIVSPEIRNNNTVTFHLNAPEAVKVELTGDFLPTQKQETPFGTFDAPGVVTLVKNDKGVWEYTTPEPLASELYSYTFIIDGVKVTDPANVYMIRDVASVTSVFIIDGGRADLYKVNAVPHGTVARRWYNSQGLKTTRRRPRVRRNPNRRTGLYRIRPCLIQRINERVGHRCRSLPVALGRVVA